jgi:hypothetical protein
VEGERNNGGERKRGGREGRGRERKREHAPSASASTCGNIHAQKVSLNIAIGAVAAGCARAAAADALASPQVSPNSRAFLETPNLNTMADELPDHNRGVEKSEF